MYYIKTEGLQFKSLPIKMNVLVEQSKLPDFLVGLENSPMAIQVMEVEIAKPLAPVVKPVYGERSTFGMGMTEDGRPMQAGHDEHGGRDEEHERPRSHDATDRAGARSNAMMEGSMMPGGMGMGRVVRPPPSRKAPTSATSTRPTSGRRWKRIRQDQGSVQDQD